MLISIKVITDSKKKFSIDSKGRFWFQFRLPLKRNK